MVEDGEMGSITLLGAVLLLQAQAVSLGAQVTPLLHHRAQEAFQRQLCALVPETPARAAVAPAEPVEAPCCDDWEPAGADVFIEASKCRALLLEVIRRAAHDWVLYRSTRRPERVYARSAYVWLFEEKPGHPWWELRQKEGEPLLAFLNICEMLDLDPEYVRARIRKMTIRDIMTAGRPAENRRGRVDEGVEDYESPRVLDIQHHTLSAYEERFALG
jgi:hypothetical protein